MKTADQQGGRFNEHDINKHGIGDDLDDFDDDSLPFVDLRQEDQKRGELYQYQISKTKQNLKKQNSKKKSQAQPNQTSKHINKYKQQD